MPVKVTKERVILIVLAVVLFSLSILTRHYAPHITCDPLWFWLGLVWAKNWNRP